MFLGLRTALYPVTDIDAGKTWYRKVLGVEPYFDQPFYVGFEVGGFELGLLPDGTAGTSGPQALWGVANASEALTHLLALGAQPLDPVHDVGDGIRVGAVLDPFGNRLAFIENPHFKRENVR